MSQDDIEPPSISSKLHIRREGGYNWCIYSDRTCTKLLSLTSKFEDLKRKGPWTPHEIEVWYGDAKNPT